MMSEMASRKPFPDQSSGSGRSVTTSRQPYIIDPIASKRVCFYKSGDPQFNGLRMVINSRTFKTFDALLDSLSKKVPLPFGVRNITTPRGVHAVHNLDELEDGKAYICSDQRKVKPINLALANKKPPPWYHARPISARRQALQLARKYPGRPKRKQETGVARTPKRLTVFRNGDPNVKHTVMLQRRTTPTFESLLDYISELMQFPVVKLHTPDGGRVDGLPALILCSGRVVAAGREAFKSANYNTQKSVPPTWLPASRMAPKRKKYIIRKKKTMSSGSKSRNYSSSSERYFVNQIRNSVAGSLCDFPSNPTGSVEMETGQLLESVAETDRDICLEDEVDGMENCMPPDDDIEKSFRVNQDGSMTVEMKVRLTIKEEETVHWTTTLTRSSVASQLSAASLPESDPEGSTLEPQNSSSTDTINKHNSKDDDDHFPPENGLTSEVGNDKEESKPQADAVFPRRAPTPGPRGYRQNHASLEMTKTVKPEEIQQNTVGSFSYREDSGTGKVTEEYCMVRQCSTRPVPKPRRVGSLDVHSYNRSENSLKSEGDAEILQMDDSGGEITETVLHVYEQQTCQDNFLANSQFSVQGVSMYGLVYGQPATSDTAHFSSSYDFELGRPSTASESMSVWKTEDMSLCSELTEQKLKTRKAGTLPSQKRKVVKVLKDQPSNPSKEHSPFKADKKAHHRSSKPKAKKKPSRQSMTPEKTRKQSNVDVSDSHKKSKPVFSSIASSKKIYGFRPKTVKTLFKLKKKRKTAGAGSMKMTNSESPESGTQFSNENPNESSPVKQKNISEIETSVSFKNHMLNVSHSEETQGKETMKRWMSVHKEKEVDKKTKSASLPELESPSEYVEHWLEKARPRPTVHPEEYSRMDLKGGVTKVSEANCEVVMTDGERTPNVPSSERFSSPNETIKENLSTEKASAQSEKTPSISAQTLHSNNPNTQIQNAVTRHSDSAFSENPGIAINTSVQKKAPSNSYSMEKTSQCTEPAGKEPASPASVLGLTSVASSPSYYMFSSPSSLASEDRPTSMSNMSDEASSPTNEKTNTSNQPILNHTSLYRNTSVKKTRLVSNLSLEKKMFQRKASVEKSALTSDTSKKEVSPPVEAVANTPQSCPSSERECIPTNTPQSHIILDMSSLASSPSYILSSPHSSLASEGRLSISPSSDEAQSPIDKSLEEKSVKSPLVTTQTDPTLSPKPSVKKTRLVSNVSLEKTLSARKASHEKSELQSDPITAKTQVSHSPTLEKSPLQRNQQLETAGLPNRPSLDKNTQLLTNPGTNKIPAPRKNLLPKRLSPYSQSLEIVSPPTKVKLNNKSLTRNHSLDNTADQKTPLLRGKLQTRISPKFTPKSLEQTPPVPSPSLRNPKQKTNNDDKVSKTRGGESITATEVKPSTTIHTTPQSLGCQPDTKPVLEKLCYSIQSIRQLTQNKRRSCLEKSNSLPDFSSHVASTFGSSSKALLAFLSVMTLKEGIANFKMHELNANSVSCAEALKMIETLREIASMEDADKLQGSLTDLQRSASIQLLQSWRGFQELSDKIKSRSSTPNSSEHNLLIVPCQNEELCDDENVINALINEFDMPKQLKEELAALPVIVEMERDEREKSMDVINYGEINYHSTAILQEQIVNVDKGICNEESNVDVKSIIKQFINIQHSIEVSPNTNCLSHRQKQMDPGSQILKEEKIWHEDKCLNLPSDHKEKIDKERFKEDKKVNSEDYPSCFDPEDNSEELNRSSHDRLSSPEEYQLTSEEETQEVDSSKTMQVSNEEKPSTTAKKHPISNKEQGNPLGWQKVSERKEEHPVVEQASFKEEESVAKYNELQVSTNNKREIQFNSPLDEEKRQSPDRCMERRVSSEKRLGSPEDEEEQDEQEEEETEVKCEDLHVITEERDFSQEEKASSENEQEVHMDQLSNKEKGQDIECSDHLVAGKERVSSLEVMKDNLDMEGCQADDLGYADVQTCEEQDTESENKTSVREKLSNFVEEPRIIIRKEMNCLRKEEHYSFDTYQTDSGNEHISCEEQDSKEIVDFENKHCSLEEGLSTSVEELTSSEEEHVSVGRYIEESYAEYHDSYIEEEPSEEEINDQMTGGNTTCYEMNKEKTICHSVIKPVPSVAERVGILEKKVSGLDERKTVIVETPGIRRLTQIETTIESETDDLTNVSQLSNEQGQTDEIMRESSKKCITNSALSMHSAPPSSLAFSYDSSGCLTRESERNKVKSIKEMFMAKSVADIQYGHRQLPSPNTSDLSDSRPETSDSGGHRSHASLEVSSGEDESHESVIKSIAKGIVRRTIERLYGKKEDEVKDSNDERPQTPSKQRLRESAIRSILSPLHMARSKVLSDLSYFNPTSSFESYNEPTRCIAFNAQVGPGDSVLIDKGRWLLDEITPIRKSISEPIAIHKGTELSTKTVNEHNDTKEEIPYSLFSMSTQSKDHPSELEDETKPKVAQCTYFTLPHGSDSDLYQEEMRTFAEGNLMIEKEDKTEEGNSRTLTEKKNERLPAFTPPDFKIVKDNKVHPLKDGPVEGQVVVLVQPGKGTGLKGQTVVNRRPQEPDALEMLYVFCGQHCPVL